MRGKKAIDNVYVCTFGYVKESSVRCAVIYLTLNVVSKSFNGGVGTFDRESSCMVVVEGFRAVSNGGENTSADRYRFIIGADRIGLGDFGIIPVNRGSYIAFLVEKEAIGSGIPVIHIKALADEFRRIRVEYSDIKIVFVTDHKLLLSLKKHLYIGREGLKVAFNLENVSFNVLKNGIVDYKLSSSEVNVGFDNCACVFTTDIVGCAILRLYGKACFVCKVVAYL